jgi:hypothetical protein
MTSAEVKKYCAKDPFALAAYLGEGGGGERG